jgi:hypothetical protein
LVFFVGYGGAQVNTDLSALVTFAENRDRKSFERCYYLHKIAEMIIPIELEG